MNGLDGIIRQLEAQKAAIEKALTALRGIEGIAITPAPATKRATPRKR